MLRVTYADISCLDYRPALPEMSDYRKSRLKQVKSEAGKRQGAGAELLLQRAVLSCDPAAKLPLDLVADENGKLYLKNGGLFFNLSHSEDMALCALSDREVGADIQVEKPFQERLARRFFAPEELHFILSSDRPDFAFTQIWAMKESYIKALGLGLKLPLDSFAVNFRGGPHVGTWKLWHTCVGKYHIAVCSEEHSSPELFREMKL